MDYSSDRRLRKQNVQARTTHHRGEAISAGKGSPTPGLAGFIETMSL